MEWCGNDNDCAADESLKRRSINRTVKWNRAVFVKPEQKITTSSSVCRKPSTDLQLESK